VFVVALIAGTGCSIISKILLDMKSIGIAGEQEKFSSPLFQSLAMFLGMSCGLVVHFAVVFFRIPFPGYSHAQNGYSALKTIQETPLHMYFVLLIPSAFDLVATTLCYFGLKYVTASIFQMMRGSAVIFVAVIKQFFLKERLKSYMWVGVLLNAAAIVLIGIAAMLTAKNNEHHHSTVQTAESKPLHGIVLILLGAFVTSLQYIVEERVMTRSDLGGARAPPLLLIGMEGVWGSLLMLLVVYPLAFAWPGTDHGSFENLGNTLSLYRNSSEIQTMFIAYFVLIFVYNTTGALVTLMLSSVWHAILDNFRPVTIWGTGLTLYYTVSDLYGEHWNEYSWLQLAGMCVLVYGTAVYNAPNPGSIRLTGGAVDCCLDFSEEYEEVAVSENTAAKKNNTHHGERTHFHNSGELHVIYV
jgi:drug/metabolite transporter (DMT)-like permease